MAWQEDVARDVSVGGGCLWDGDLYVGSSNRRTRCLGERGGAWAADSVPGAMGSGVSEAVSLFSGDTGDMSGGGGRVSSNS